MKIFAIENKKDIKLVIVDFIIKNIIEIIKCKNNKEKIYIYTELFYYIYNKYNK